MTSKSRKWFVDINAVRTDYIVIEDLEQFKSPTPPSLHPNHPDYSLFWAKEIKKCIEGIWGKEFSGYRYMPGRLYFFGNYGVLEHTNESKNTISMKPKIVDYFWDFAYMSTVCYGFSGFSKDDEYNCRIELKLYYEGFSTELPEESLNKQGQPKKYIPPYEYITMIHDKKKGKALYGNPTSNNMILGSRGGGKSYWAAIGELEYNFVFDGAKTYEDFTEGVRSLQCVGSSDTNKSSEMLEKFLTSQLAKTTNSNKNYVKWFGIWTEIKGEEEIIYACPLYIKSLGSIAPSNKSNKFRDAYKKKVGNKYQEVGGTGSAIAHVNYSIKKGDGAQAAAGGRYLYSNIEEVGLVENFVDVLGSNEGTIARVGTRFGVQSAQGTSGNIEFIQAAKKVFLDPLSYFMLPFENKNGTEGADGKICYFIPYYMTLFKYKDENGNTNFERAIEHVNREREQKSKSKDPRVLRNFTMNKPCYTHEMWQTDQGYYLPSEEASVRERELMAGEMYRQLMTPVELVWDDSQLSGVNYRILHNIEPITDFPIPKDLKDPSGCVVIYEMPEPNAPPDLYNFVGHDPYVEEDITKGGSLGVTYILKNPKYIPQGHTGNIIVASYIGKPIKGLDYYYEQQEKLIAFYGNAIESLWYEKNRGEYCRAYYMKRNKMHLLARTPQYSTGSNIYQRNITSTGFLVGANGSIAKKNLLKMVKDWLLEETAFTVDDNTTSKMNIFRLNCIFLVRQIAQFDIDGNFDAVSAFIGCILGLREYEILLTESIQSQQDQTQDYFGNLLSNKRLFNTDYFK